MKKDIKKENTFLLKTGENASYQKHKHEKRDIFFFKPLLIVKTVLDNSWKLEVVILGLMEYMNTLVKIVIIVKKKLLILVFVTKTKNTFEIFVYSSNSIISKSTKFIFNNARHFEK